MEFEIRNERKNSSQPIDGEAAMEKTLIKFVEALFELEGDERLQAMQRIAGSQVYCSKCGYAFLFGQGLITELPEDIVAKVKCANCNADAYCKRQ